MDCDNDNDNPFPNSPDSVEYFQVESWRESGLPRIVFYTKKAKGQIMFTERDLKVSETAYSCGIADNLDDFLSYALSGKRDVMMFNLGDTL